VEGAGLTLFATPNPAFAGSMERELVLASCLGQRWFSGRGDTLLCGFRASMLRYAWREADGGLSGLRG